MGWGAPASRRLCAASCRTLFSPCPVNISIPSCVSHPASSVFKSSAFLTKKVLGVEEFTLEHVTLAHGGRRPYRIKRTAHLQSVIPAAFKPPQIPPQRLVPACELPFIARLVDHLAVPEYRCRRPPRFQSLPDAPALNQDSRNTSFCFSRQLKSREAFRSARQSSVRFWFM